MLLSLDRTKRTHTGLIPVFQVDRGPYLSSSAMGDYPRFWGGIHNGAGGARPARSSINGYSVAS